MPTIAPTDFEAIDRLAAIWIERGLRSGTFETTPSALTSEQRRADPAAAAAFSAVTWRLQEHKEFIHACRCCGLWTASWCEGCYSRAVFEPALEFSALCSECDTARLVCPPCRHHGKTWTDGRAAYENHFKDGDTSFEFQFAAEEEPTTGASGSGIFRVTSIQTSGGSREAGPRSDRPPSQ